MSLTPGEVRAVIDDPARRAVLPAATLARVLLDRIGELDPLLGAFITVTPELALADAERADAARAAGRPLPLDGMPVAVKDLLDLAGVPTTGASRLFEGRVAAADAPAVACLREAGAVVLGKTNLHELAYGATTDNPPPFGACRNPWDLERIAGGSSGGSAAALAADLCAGALGSDTGGSIRIPAALCGVSGLRPTYGTISSRGALHVAPTLDTIGPMARSVDDVARLHAVLAVHDPEDPYAVSRPTPEPAETDVASLRIGLPRTFFFDRLDPEIEASVRTAAEALARLGARVEEIDLPAGEDLCRATAAIVRSEALAVYREHVDARPELIGEQIRERFRLGEELRGEEVADAQLRMREWQQTLRRVFGAVEAVLTPATNTVAPRLGEPSSIETTWNLTYLTYPWSLSGLPTLTFPCGFTRAGLPVGVQLTAGPLREPVLFAIGSAYQATTGWHRARPDDPPRRGPDTSAPYSSGSSPSR
jgi:aspartyl-tRNA(Asn)/glutamyl-tRNA(Gln) amidotransferase subunit A